jgi:hypothetical protein
MTPKVQDLFPDQPTLGHYVRIGSTNHVQLEGLLESGRLTVDRAVFDGGLIFRQAGLLRAFRGAGAELVLDTDVAELSSAKYFDGALKQAPWAVAGRPLSVQDFQGSTGLERISCIARFAVEHGFRTVLSPTHLVKGPRDLGLRVDFETAEKLRAALDAEGGHDITLDFPLVFAAGVLRDEQVISILVDALKGLPVENLWVRSSGFGADATPIGIVRYIRALRELLPLSRPIIADGVAGLAGIAALAFGAASGIAHGVGIHETFKSNDWNKRRKVGGGGQPTRVLISALDRQLELDQVQAIVATANGRRLISCNVPRCCPKGLEDMLRDPKAHYCYQRRLAVDSLTSVPYARRAGHFVGRMVTDARERGRLLVRLKLADPDTHKALADSCERVQRIYDVLEHFHAQNDFSKHSPPIRDRRGTSRNVVGGLS